MRQQVQGIPYQTSMEQPGYRWFKGIVIWFRGDNSIEHSSFFIVESVRFFLIREKYLYNLEPHHKNDLANESWIQVKCKFCKQEKGCREYRETASLNWRKNLWKFVFIVFYTTEFDFTVSATLWTFLHIRIFPLNRNYIL